MAWSAPRRNLYEGKNTNFSINEIEKLWEAFYMYEGLKCYNANCYNASTVMIGLSSEVLVEELINEFSKLLGKTK